MANGTVGVAQAAAPDRQIDNSAVTVGGITVHRQRTDNIPTRVSTYFAGTSGSVSVGVGYEIVAVSVHCTTAGTVSIAGGSDIPIPANSQFSDTMLDAPIVGIGAGSVVCTGSDSYYVRVRPVIV